MSKKLGQGVTVVLADDKGEVHTFLEGSELPAWAAKKCGPHVYRDGGADATDDVDDVTADSAAEADRQAAARAAAGAGDGKDAGEGADGGTKGKAGSGKSKGKASDIPPLTGAGSGVEPWTEYAKGLGLEVDEGAKKDDVVALVKSAGHPTEPPA